MNIAHLRNVPLFSILAGIFVVLSGCKQIVLATPPESAALIITMESVESAHVDPRRVDIWLPPGYEDSDKTYPVIYAQDGQNLFTAENNPFGSGEWGVDETMQRLIESGEIEAAIVVGVWNTEKRFREYQPEIPFSRYSPELQERLTEMYKGGPLSEAYLRFLTGELKPLIDKEYRTQPQRSSTFIMGSSMGGLISIYALARYPDVFGGAACLSTHWPVALEDEPATGIGIVDYLSEVIPQAGEHIVYFDFGTEYIDAWYEKHQTRMDDVMRARGYEEGIDWVTRKFEGAGHNEDEWSKRVHIPISLLLGKGS